MNINTGLSFVQFGEQLNYNLTNYFNTDTTLVFSDSITFLSWDSINHIVYVSLSDYEVDTTFLDSTVLNNNKKNRHSYLTVPLMIGYNFNFKKLNINLKAGIGIGFLLSSNAENINYNVSQIIATEPKKLQINYVFSPTINYELSKHFALQISPQVLLNSNSLNSYNNIKQQYTNWSMQVGLQYTFMKKSKIKN